MTPSEVASAAHRVEVERLGAESGVQDQVCAAYGGINYIEVPSYPESVVSQLRVRREVWWELDRRLALVFLGRAHVSSEVHRAVIASLTADPGAHTRLEELRHAAEDARRAVTAGDLVALGHAMARNTDAQRRLHSGLVNAEVERAIDVAAAHGALGWKLNGAGGDGGSLTLLCGGDRDRPAKDGLLGALQKENSSLRVVPTRLSRRGLRVWEL